MFRIDIPDEQILPDYDEMRYQDPTGTDREWYDSDLSCSLLEFKTCRINTDISFDEYTVDYFCLVVDRVKNIGELFNNACCNYEYVTSHYTKRQKSLIKLIPWKRA